MNALELANALVDTDYTPLKAEAAGMLRRLQAEKEALAADCEALTNALARANRVYDFDNPFLDVDAIDRSAGHVDKTANDRHDLTDERIIEIRKSTRANGTEAWADTLAFAHALLDAQRSV